MRVRGLYPIVDAAALAARGLDVREFARQVLEARPPLLQLRAKELGAQETLDFLRSLLPLCRAAGTLLFANDRPDLAVLADADGVHVGQTDLSVADVRRFAPRLLVGKSTHSPGELEAALAERPDYVAYGPVFATGSKRNPDPVVGLEGLAFAVSLAKDVGIPVVAIGGLDRERVAGVARFGVLGAVIGGLVPTTAEGMKEVSGWAREMEGVLANGGGLARALTRREARRP